MRLKFLPIHVPQAFSIKYVETEPTVIFNLRSSEKGSTGIFMTSEDGRIGIVIPTHNRYVKLRALLASIEQWMTREVTAVVVVDDSDQPVDLTGEFNSINLKQIFLGERTFISRAKNLGWRSLSAEYIYFIDDDNVISEQTIAPVLGVISKSKSIGAIMPAVLYKSRPDLVWVYATPLSSAGILKHKLIGRNESRNSSFENRLLNTDALPNASIVRRKALENVDGFDETLVVNSSMDLCLRMKAKGWRVFAYTGGFVYHDVEAPGRLGWWAIHGAIDPGRVRYEIRDWFILASRLRRNEKFFRIKVIIASRFVIPNLLAYFARGRERSKLARSLITGYLEGLTFMLLTEHPTSRMSAITTNIVRQ
jgi:GT2 family glycosyltransferase